MTSARRPGQKRRPGSGRAGQWRPPARARRPSELQRRAWAAWVPQGSHGAPQSRCQTAIKLPTPLPFGVQSVGRFGSAGQPRSPSEALSNRYQAARPAAFWRAGPRLVTLCTGWGGAALSSWWVYTRAPRWKTAALRPGPTRPPARPSSARLSAGRPAALASPGQLADVFWLAGYTGLCSPHRLGPLAGAVLGGKAYLYLASTRSSAASAPASPRPE